MAWITPDGFIYYGGRNLPEDTEISDAPSIFHEWRNGAWILNLQNAQNHVWSGIKSERELRRTSGVLVAGHWFHTDDASRIQHLGLTMMGAGIPAGLQWKTMDGSFIAMTQALANQIFQAVVLMDMTNFAIAESHRIAMLSCADPTIYDYSSGWTPSFAS